MRIQTIATTLLFSFLFSISRSEELLSNNNDCRILVDAYDRAAMLSRNYLAGQSNRWPNGVVPYTISPNFTDAHKQVIMDSMKHIQDRTCITFRPKSGNEAAVNIVPYSGGCFANIGYNRWRQNYVVNLNPWGCVYLGVAVHEFLHILGFAHEQTRPDRDNFVQINWENIRDGMESNFWRAQGENELSLPYCGRVSKEQYNNCSAGFRTTVFDLPYDFGSIMHYSTRAFSKNGQETITLKQEPGVIMPNRNGMSSLDVQKTRAAYGCTEASTTEATTADKSTTTTKDVTTTKPTTTTTKTTSTTTTTTTTTPTTTTTTVPTPTTAKGCVDESEYCRYFTRMCGRSPYINKKCPKTCFDCDCKNNLKDASCELIKQGCSRYHFVRNNCHETCGSCS